MERWFVFHNLTTDEATLIVHDAPTGEGTLLAAPRSFVVLSENDTTHRQDYADTQRDALVVSDDVVCHGPRKILSPPPNVVSVTSGAISRGKRGLADCATSERRWTLPRERLRNLKR